MIFIHLETFLLRKSQQDEQRCRLPGSVCATWRRCSKQFMSIIYSPKYTRPNCIKAWWYHPKIYVIPYLCLPKTGPCPCHPKGSKGLVSTNIETAMRSSYPLSVANLCWRNLSREQAALFAQKQCFRSLFARKGLFIRILGLCQRWKLFS